jgi:methylated-DNA-protein-cysteine methyltransferase-like protein
MNPFTEAALEIIKNIPPGYVMTYGQIAALAGNSRGARQVSRILHSMGEKYKLPWHRVINRKGELPKISGETGYLQKQLLESEGVEVSPQFTVDLDLYQFHYDIGSLM